MLVFPYHHFKYILPQPLACRVSAEKSANIFMGIPLYVICCFSLSAFNIFSLNLIFLLGKICVVLCFSLGLSCQGLSVLPGFGLLFPFLFLLSFWDSSNVKVGTFNVVPEICMQVKKQQSEPDMEQWTRKEYCQGCICHLTYLTYM